VSYVVPKAAGEAGSNLPYDLHSGRLAKWQMVWDETYDQRVSPADGTFNIAGWNSSYTGLPIP